MRKTPSYLKGLAETRARAAGDVLRLERLQGDVAQAHEKARFELAAADALICRFDPRLDPTQIPPLRAWAGRYGKRGALREAILKYLREAHPQELTTTEIAVRLQAELGLDFTMAAACEEWVHNSVRAQLRRLAREGEAEHTSEASPGTKVGRWRLISIGPSEVNSALAFPRR